MVKIAITGSNGFIAQHLINRFQNQKISSIESIVTIDKNPKCQNYLDYPEIIPMTHFQTDLTDTKILENVFSDCDVVFHLARKRSNFLFETEMQQNLLESYIRDNITATESVISAMFSSNVQYLIFLSDAYANLEVGDNFGLSEDNFPGIAKSFIMGQAGESRIRAELIGRNAVGKPLKNGKDFRATFLRPVFVYGEGDVKFFESLIKVAKGNGNSIPIVDGPSNGMFQYIYAGNLAGMLESSMTTLMNQPERCNGDYFYCMEDPKATKISEFLSPIASALNISFEPKNNFFLAYWSTVFSQFKKKIFGFDPKKSEFSSTTFRFLFGYAYGFANRKQQLIIDYRPEIDSSEALAKTVKWIQKK